MNKLPLLLLTLCLAACSQPVCDGNIDQLIWATDGGGQISFTVTPDDGNYQVRLESYGFRDQGVDSVLKPEDGEAYDLVKAIFANKRDLRKDTFTPRGATGSWTSITLVCAAGNQNKIDNISTGGELNALYEFAAKGAKPDEIEGDVAQLIWETQGGGDIRFSITPDDGDYKIRLERFEGGPQNADLVLRSDSGAAYAIVKSIFTLEHNLRDDTFTPGGPTGTWTSITLVGVDGTEMTVDNLRVSSGSLRTLYDFAAAAAKESEPSPGAGDSTDETASEADRS